MFAIISYKGNQYKVKEGSQYRIALVSEEDKKAAKLLFKDVLLISNNGENIIGTPSIENASVQSEILGEVRDEKVTTLKFHSKKRYQRNIGHKQKKTLIKISKISFKNEK